MEGRGGGEAQGVADPKNHATVGRNNRLHVKSYSFGERRPVRRLAGFLQQAVFDIRTCNR
jgi:hypothetical protein